MTDFTTFTANQIRNRQVFAANLAEFLYDLNTEFRFIGLESPDELIAATAHDQFFKLSYSNEAFWFSILPALGEKPIHFPLGKDIEAVNVELLLKALAYASANHGFLLVVTECPVCN